MSGEARGRPLIAIDGPAGSGKSTLATRLAEALHLPYVNTGLMYRALTLAALRGRVDLEDGPALADALGDLTFDLSSSTTPPSLNIDGMAPSRELSAPDVERSVSGVARHPEVRAAMRAEQRRLGAGGAVMEGRDIGSVIFPDADVKVFLVATETERVDRRVRERRSGAGGADSREQIGAELVVRDASDSRVNPFVPAPDALRVDTSGRDADEVFAEVLAAVRDRIGS